MTRVGRGLRSPPTDAEPQIGGNRSQMRLVRIRPSRSSARFSLLAWVCERALNIRHNEVDYNNAVEVSCPFAGHLGHSARQVSLGTRRVIVVGSRNGAH